MITANFSPAAGRFVWKEYRMLRGLWVAVLVLGVLVQWVSYALGQPAIDWATVFFSIALGSAALYAVGVAATTFSVEHEEETYGYIACLPTSWLPVFAGKLLFAATSALALAASLSVIGWILCGFELPGGRDTPRALGVLGVAIIEALAWGTLFSLVLRQPLLAALLAIGAASLAVTSVINLLAEGATPALTIGSYLQVLPARLAIVLCVAVADVLLARRWLTTGNRPTYALTAVWSQEVQPSTAFGQLVRFISRERADFPTCSRRVVLSHLLWQTWRQSWQTMLVMPAIVTFICFALGLILALGGGVSNRDGSEVALTPFVIALVASGLFASTVFYADQRRHQYRFLAEHAAWPRYVWLCRLLVWLVPVVLVLAIAAGVLAASASGWLEYWGKQMEGYLRDQQYWWGQAFAEQWSGIRTAAQGLLFGVWGILAGFALGQFCSMFFRQALIAGFAAMVTAVPLITLGVAVWAWELPPFSFLLPIIVGMFAATWLRAPDWIIDRSRLSGLLKVATAITLPIAFVAWLLPDARLAGVTADHWALRSIGYSLGVDLPNTSTEYPSIDAPAVVAKWVKKYESSITPEARSNADRLIRLSETVEIPPKPERTPTHPDPTTADWKVWARNRVELNLEILDEVVKLSRQDCRFPTLLRVDSNTSDPLYDHLHRLVDILGDAGVVAAEDGDLDAALQFHLAALKAWEQLWYAQPSYFTQSLWDSKRIRAQLVDWAANKGQTPQRIQKAIAALDRIYPEVNARRPDADSLRNLSAWSPPPTLVVDYLLLRGVLMGDKPPSFLGQHAGLAEYAALLANELPFERERAIRVLDFMLVDQTAQWHGVAWRLDQKRLQQWSREAEKTRGEGAMNDMGRALRDRIRRAFYLSYGHHRDTITDDRYPPYSWLRTTYLLRDELQAMAPFGYSLQRFADAQVEAWGLRQQLALVAYRLEHRSYPDLLDALVPNYLPFVPIDAYSGRPFEYRPDGLPLELRGGYPERIEPNSPLLWSVGARDAHLRLEFVIEAVDPTTDLSDESAEVRRQIYVLEESPGPSYLRSPLVFPLPK